MAQWWQGLTPVNQAFYTAAAFFSVLLVWQLLAALAGLDGQHGDADAVPVHGDGHAADGADMAGTAHAFQLLSLRSIISFFTLFAWGGALYLNRGEPVSRALGWAALWGLAAMVTVSLMIWAMRRMVSVGTRRIETCLGLEATVYLDIPAQGAGEIKVPVSGIVSNVRARSEDGRALKAGTPVRVVRAITPTLVSVAAAEP